jgi:hypothetical protein
MYFELMPDDLPIGRTMKAASTISVRDGHAIVKAGEFIEARFGAGTSPSLAARKTLALLIAKAAGEAWRPGSHVIANAICEAPTTPMIGSRTHSMS